jgi:hypothetical protein
MRPMTSGFVALGVLILATSGAAAQSGGGFDLSWNTIDGGGGTSVGGIFTLSGTIGQADAGTPMTGGIFSLSGGFWPGASVAQPTGCSPADVTNTDGDNPGTPDNAVDNGDFSAFFSAFFLPETDPTRLLADIANTDGETYLEGAGGDGAIDNGDFNAFFTYFFQGCPLP